MKMSRKYRDTVIWKENKDWYYIDEERDRYVLTDKAPAEARRSFERWKRINGVDWDDFPAPKD